MSTLVRGVGPDFLDAVRARLGAHGTPDGALGIAVEAAARDTGAVLGSSALRSVTRTVRDELFGAGRLQVFLDDPDVTDVLVNGPRDVWVERGGRLSRADVDLGGDDDVRALAVRLAAAGGQRLDDASPAVDARLPDGTRLHAVLPPVAGACALISLRVVRSRAFTVEQLVASGTLARPLVPVVRALVATRANLLISGATGSGKTTLLAALLSLVPHDERLVIVEESGELAPAHPHVVRLLARHANVDGAGRVDLPDLVRHALRMRPDRIVLGECRGAEVREVLAALNTGHDGGCATVHANAAADVPARLEALAALAGMSREAVAAQAASAFDAVLHLRRADRRYVAEVGVVRRGAHGELEVACAIRVEPSGATEPGPAWPALADRLGLPAARVVLEARPVSGLVGMLVALAALAACGSRGRSLGARVRERPVKGLVGARSARSAPDLSAVLLGVCAQLRAGATPDEAWSRATGAASVGPVPTVDALLTATSRPARARFSGRTGLTGHAEVRGRTEGRGHLELRACTTARGPSGLRGGSGLGRRSDDGAVQRVRAALAAARLSDELGAPLAGVLERIASAVAADEEADGERRSALAGPRSTAQVLAWLPLLGVALGALLGADPLAVVLSGGLGTASAVLGVVMLVLGRWWTAALLARAGRAGEGRPGTHARLIGSARVRADPARARA